MGFKVKEITPSVEHFDQLPNDGYIRPKETAQLLGISIATFWRLVKQQKLQVHKLTERTTTVKVGDLRKFMEGA